MLGTLETGNHGCYKDSHDTVVWWNQMLLLIESHVFVLVTTSNTPGLNIFLINSKQCGWAPDCDFSMSPVSWLVSDCTIAGADGRAARVFLSPSNSAFPLPCKEGCILCWLCASHRIHHLALERTNV